MSVFFVSAGETAKKQDDTQGYSIEERKLMADILYEDLHSKRSNVKFDSEERRIMAEIAREKDLEDKVNQCKHFEKKREQIKFKREEIETEKKSKAIFKLKRAESMKKPDLVSDIAKKYDTKRAEVLDRLKTKDVFKKMKLENAMRREKPVLTSDVTKKYDERRAEALERIQKKQDEAKSKYEQKMNKSVREHSAAIPEVVKNYDNRRAEVLGRIKRKEEEKKLKLEKKLERLENKSTISKQITREVSFLGGSEDHLDIISKKDVTPDIFQHITDDDEGLSTTCDSSSKKIAMDVDCEKELSAFGDSAKTYITDVDHEMANTSNINSIKNLTRYSSFDTKSVIPPIGCR